MTSELTTDDAAQPQPRPPLLDGPRWPAWYGPVGFVVGFIVGSVLGVAILALAGIDPDKDKTTYEVVGTLILDLCLVGTAIGFAATVETPRPWHFGLRTTPLGATLKTAVYGAISYLTFSFVYVGVLHPHGKQDVVQKLGADKGGFAVVAAAFVVIMVAPACEEMFFRGFFYRALRSRLAVPAAVAVDGLVFAAIHYTGPKTLSLLPILGALAVMFCLVYEFTGSIFPTIAMHALNNSVAFASTVHGSGGTAAAFGAGMVALCIVLPATVRPFRVAALR